MANLDFKLPHVIDKYLDSWIGTGTVATTLLAGVAAGIFVHVEEQIKYSNTPALPPGSVKANILLGNGYLSMLLNCSAIVIAFLLAQRIIETPLKAAGKGIMDEATISNDPKRLMEFYIDWWLWKPMLFYWKCSLFLGILSIFLEIFLYLWFLEPNMAVKVTVTVILGVFGVIPMAVYGADSLFRKQAHNPATVPATSPTSPLRSPMSDRNLPLQEPKPLLRPNPVTSNSYSGRLSSKLLPPGSRPTSAGSGYASESVIGQ